MRLFENMECGLLRNEFYKLLTRNKNQLQTQFALQRELKKYKDKLAEHENEKVDGSEQKLSIEMEKEMEVIQRQHPEQQNEALTQIKAAQNATSQHLSDDASVCNEQDSIYKQHSDLELGLKEKEEIISRTSDDQLRMNQNAVHHQREKNERSASRQQLIHTLSSKMKALRDEHKRLELKFKVISSK